MKEDETTTLQVELVQPEIVPQRGFPLVINLSKTRRAGLVCIDRASRAKSV
jgi:hypothetical protein